MNLLRFPAGLDESFSRLRWADWVELGLLFTAAETFSRADMLEALESYYPEDETELDQIVEEAFREIAFRELLLSDTYPLSHRGTHIARLRPREHCLPFALLLALGVQKFYPETTPSAGGWHEPAKLFEYVVSAALQRYVNGRAIRIGTPREPPVPYEFAGCLAYLGQEMTEEAHQPVNPTVGAGDEHCDVVGWAPFVDGKPGQLVVLAQCVIGDDWRRRLHELRIHNVWDRQIAWLSPPIRAFAVPFLIDDDPAEWGYVCSVGGVHFDRLRLISLVRDGDLHLSVLARIRAWCDEFAAKLPYAD